MMRRQQNSTDPELLRTNRTGDTCVENSNAVWKAPDGTVLKLSTFSTHSFDQMQVPGANQNRFTRRAQFRRAAISH
jgi:hypothetical protein